MSQLPSAPKPPVWPLDALSRVGPFAVHPGQATRPLRVTIDWPGGDDDASSVADDGAFAWALLRELIPLSDLDTAFTVPGEHSWLDVQLDEPARSYTVTSRNAKGEPTLWTGVDEWEIWSPDSAFPRGGHLYRKLIVAAAHTSAHRDLFVTLDPVLLAERRRLDRANIVHPTEALPIIHLHLRMQPRFVYRVAGRSTFTMDRAMFFLVALRDQVPSLWQLIRRTSTIPTLDAQLVRLGNAVRSKCLRCLEARDELALLFYASNTDRERRGYHFTYALLLLSGALDALAKFAYLVYQPDASKASKASRSIYMRNVGKQFGKELEDLGAQRLLEIVASKDFGHFCELVWRPRNRIHADEYDGVLYHSGLRSQALISVDSEDGASMTAAAQALGGVWRFGLTGRCAEPSIEPYTYMLEILQRGFAFIEEIVRAIDFVRHPGYDAAGERPDPPSGANDVFSADTLRRVRCLSALDRARASRLPQPSPTGASL